MATLVVRGVPTDLYEQLKQRAKQERRTVPAEVLYLIDRAFKQDDAIKRHQEALQRIIEQSHLIGPVSMDSTELIREDRER